ncbi:GIY-YIG nuclease family protein [Streptomyces sp. NPDC021100]|uniref:GIY-YIG nuclease family protein n=1 Tax=Streptomyces sp. NPDC021100 TaxID=3365114 RepID=UPI003797E3FF
MFTLPTVTTDPAWEAIDSYLDGFQDFPGNNKEGYVYAVEVEGARRRLKIGCTTGPRRRITGFRDDARNIGDRVTRAWVSPLHSNFRATEKRSLQEAREISPSFTKTSEWFPSLPFDTAQTIIARQADSTIQAWLAEQRHEHEREPAADKKADFAARYDTPRPSQPSSPPQNEPAAAPRPLVAGTFIPIPAHIRDRLNPSNGRKRRSRRYPMAIL